MYLEQRIEELTRRVALLEKLAEVRTFLPGESRAAMVLAAVAGNFEFKVEDVSGRNREENLTRARHIAFYVAHKTCGMSKSRLGVFFKRDHGTILYGVRRIEHEMETDPFLKATVEKLIKVSQGVNA